MDKQFLEALKNDDHVKNKEAWKFALQASAKHPIKPPEEQNVRSNFSIDPPEKFIVNHNKGKLFNYISLSLHHNNPQRCALYLCDMKYKLVYDTYIWYLYYYDTNELIVESNVFDYILTELFKLEN